jgi:hypothetical protein
MIRFSKSRTVRLLLFGFVRIIYKSRSHTGCPESPRPPSRFQHAVDARERILPLLANIPSVILSDPGKTPDPVPEHVLDVVKSEVIQY